MMQHLTAIADAAQAWAPTRAPGDAPNTEGLATWLRTFIGPIFLAIVSIVAIFFLFTREITRFVQFIVLTLVVAVIFYWPGILVSIATAAANALGVDTNQ